MVAPVVEFSFAPVVECSSAPVVELAAVELEIPMDVDEPGRPEVSESPVFALRGRAS